MPGISPGIFSFRFFLFFAPRSALDKAAFSFVTFLLAAQKKSKGIMDR